MGRWERVAPCEDRGMMYLQSKECQDPLATAPTSWKARQLSVSADGSNQPWWPFDLDFQPPEMWQNEPVISYRSGGNLLQKSKETSTIINLTFCVHHIKM